MTVLPNEPVEEVRAVSVLGAKVMEGRWEHGETHVLISPVEPMDAEGARLAVKCGEIR
jgi:hypothetical protein